MDNLHERVGLAIYEAIKRFEEQDLEMSVSDYSEVARQAICAMRHPSADMMEVIQHLPKYHNRMDMWCAMIDVALGRIVLKEMGDGDYYETID
jgi:hypothetical protein